MQTPCEFSTSFSRLRKAVNRKLFKSATISNKRDKYLQTEFKNKMFFRVIGRKGYNMGVKSDWLLRLHPIWTELMKR